MRRRSRPPRPSLGTRIAGMAIAYLGYRLHPEAFDQLAQEIDRRADFKPYGVEIGGLRAVDWIAAAIDRRPEWRLA